MSFKNNDVWNIIPLIVEQFIPTYHKKYQSSVLLGLCDVKQQATPMDILTKDW